MAEERVQRRLAAILTADVDPVQRRFGAIFAVDVAGHTRLIREFGSASPRRDAGAAACGVHRIPCVRRRW